MTNIIKHCRGEKKRGIRAIDWFTKKLIIPAYEISKCPEHEIKSKIGTIFVNEKILEEYSVKIYETDPYFCEHYKGKIQTDKNEYEYILFRIDLYFIEYFLAIEIDTDRGLIFEEKKTNSTVNLLELTLVGKIIMQTMKLVEYRRLSIQTFINKFKEKENENKRKELEDEIKKLKHQLRNENF